MTTGGVQGGRGAVDGACDAPACAVCGHKSYAFSPVLWDGLVAEWGLSETERYWVDRQQGQRCENCGCNLRSIALGRAVAGVLGGSGTLEAALASAPAGLRVLELNGAGQLTAWLSRLPGRRAADFPEVDMRALPFADGSFDLVVHSDSLEHVPDAARGLAECARVLAPGGACAFTVPALAGRMTRARAGLPPSYHGSAATRREDFRVWWEFGADLWAWALEAGFDRVEAWAFAFPAATAWVGRKAGAVESP